ncbi:dephospho-CoA kinase [Radiobacillus kanasensis]|uniref:dephospho-CoA kinase n=1 Tax=Radiobacillus kanasensis TaxID=2844358 RepID=UPI001E6459A5|nr:dephospho-CoA kinase [Radiobacillus kanasensis]UFT98000.1 dephospho-CoA kinase [Radiobacillus kanasensis]
MGTTIGLTGGIASGKSTVSNMLKEKGIPVVDADIIARQVVEPGEEAYNQVVEAFGSEILQQNKSLDRKKLGSIVFQDEDKRSVLNSIVHPAVRKRMLAEKEEYLIKGNRAVVLDIPLLYESKLTELVDKVMVVYVNEETQLKRLKERNQLTEEEAMQRIQAQLPLKQKVEWADAVIHNNGSIQETKEQVEELVKKWQLV